MILETNCQVILDGSFLYNYVKLFAYVIFLLYLCTRKGEYKDRVGE